MTNPVLEAYLFGHVIDPVPIEEIVMVDLSQVPEECRNDDSSSFNDCELSKKALKRKRQLAVKKKRKQAKNVWRNTSLARRGNDERENEERENEEREIDEMEIDFEYSIQARPGKVYKQRTYRFPTLPSSVCFGLSIWHSVTLIK
jgi:hypothetical protein